MSESPVPTDGLLGQQARKHHHCRSRTSRGPHESGRRTAEILDAHRVTSPTPEIHGRRRAFSPEHDHRLSRLAREALSCGQLWIRPDRSNQEGDVLRCSVRQLRACLGFEHRHADGCDRRAGDVFPSRVFDRRRGHRLQLQAKELAHREPPNVRRSASRVGGCTRPDCLSACARLGVR